MGETSTLLCLVVQMIPIRQSVFKKHLTTRHNADNKHCTPPHNGMNSIIISSRVEKFARIICLGSDLKCYYVYVYNTNTTCSAENATLAKGRHG